MPTNTTPGSEPQFYNSDHTAVANFGTLGGSSFAESAFPMGTAPDGAALTQSGAFYVSAANGVRSLAIGAVPIVDSSGAVVRNSVPLYDNLTLNVSSYDQASGKLSYTVTISSAQTNDAPSSVTRSSPVYLTDNNGHQAATELLWTTVDDGVIARPDTASTPADASAAITGNVLDNDAGADGIRVTAVNGVGVSGPTTVTGQDGVLTVYGLGQYSYQLKAGATAGTDTFNYTASDNDGDSASSTLTVTVTAPAGSGQVLTANDSPGQALTGGAGNDTLNAGHNSVVETGAGGADVFAFGATPWNAGHITDFTPGTDRIDLSALLRASGYAGSDPIGDGYVSLQSDGAGGTNLFYDTDGRASGNTIQYKITDLDHVSPNGLTWAQLSGAGGGSPPPPPPPPPTGGQVLTANDSPGQTLTGGDGADTLNAGHNSVVETGAGGADVFAFGDTPWNAGHITDFMPGSDRIDLSALFRASGYAGSDPVGDGYVSLQADGQGGTNVFYDTDGRASGNTIQFKITDLDHVSPNGLTWAQLSGGGAGDPPPQQAPTFGFAQDSGYGAVEGSRAGSVATIRYTVALSAPAQEAVTATWTVSPSGPDPVSADDFGGRLPTGTVRIEPGATTGYFEVYATSDTTPEADETFTVTLTNVTGAASGRLTKPGVILNDDGPTPAPGGQILTANDSPGQTLTGGAGNDTLNAGHNSVVETGAGGADRFAFDVLPWNAGHVTDFTAGTDHVDLSALLSASHYAGSDPFADGYVSLQADGAGGTKVLFDTDGHAGGNTIQFAITDLDHILPSQLTASDFIFR